MSSANALFIEAGLAMFVLAGLIGLSSAAASGLRYYLPGVAGYEHKNLDGLRAICASAVMFAHAKALYNLHAGNGFQLVAPLDQHLSTLASLGVGMFFQITGFLFWDKVIRAKGNVDPARLYAARIRRLVPLYVVFGIAALGFALLRAGFLLNRDADDLVRAVAATFSFGFAKVPAFNGDFFYSATIGVTWTLAYEMCFYAVLPLLAWLYRRRLLMLVIIGYGIYQLAYPTEWLIANFGAGMLIARSQGITAVERWLRACPSVLFAALVLCSIALLLVYNTPFAEAIVLAAILYGAVRAGHFSLVLQTPGLVAVGRISYSLYLLHSLLLYQMYWMLGAHNLLPLDQVQQWALFYMCGLVVIMVSALTYRHVEHPFLSPRPKVVPESPRIVSGSESR